jgi:hypothetical protein
MAINKMTGIEFRYELLMFLATLKDDDEVFFGSGDLSFYRFKPRGPITGPQLYNLEFNEAYKVTSD